MVTARAKGQDIVNRVQGCNAGFMRVATVGAQVDLKLGRTRVSSTGFLVKSRV